MAPACLAILALLFSFCTVLQWYGRLLHSYVYMAPVGSVEFCRIFSWHAPIGSVEYCHLVLSATTYVADPYQHSCNNDIITHNAFIQTPPSADPYQHRCNNDIFTYNAIKQTPPITLCLAKLVPTHVEVDCDSLVFDVDPLDFASEEQLNSTDLKPGTKKVIDVTDQNVGGNTTKPRLNFDERTSSKVKKKRLVLEEISVTDEMLAASEWEDPIPQHNTIEDLDSRMANLKFACAAEREAQQDTEFKQMRTEIEVQTKETQQFKQQLKQLKGLQQLAQQTQQQVHQTQQQQLQQLKQPEQINPTTTLSAHSSSTFTQLDPPLPYLQPIPHSQPLPLHPSLQVHDTQTLPQQPDTIVHEDMHAFFSALDSTMTCEDERDMLVDLLFTNIRVVEHSMVQTAQRQNWLALDSFHSIV